MKAFISAFFLLVGAVSCFAQLESYESFDAFQNNVLDRLEDEKTYAVNFWATWCKPCIAEMPFFEQIHRESEDVEVILVSLDFKKDIDKRLLPFLKERQLEARVVSLTDSKYNNWIDRISPEWSGAIPATVYIRGNQKRFFEKEYHSTDEILSDIKSLNN